MTTVTAASEAETVSHPIHSNPVLQGDDRLVYSVAEVGDLLGISRAFAYEEGAGLWSSRSWISACFAPAAGGPLGFHWVGF